MTIYDRLGEPLAASQIPVIFHPDYVIPMAALGRLLHSFEPEKWRLVADALVASGQLCKEQMYSQHNVISRDDLLRTHSAEYLDSLEKTETVARILEVWPLVFIPYSMFAAPFLRAMRLQTAGSVLGARFAMERGWAINIGGGFHHASGLEGGQGFCVYADITLAIEFLRDTVESVKTVMIIDLDAHQGNGHETDFLMHSQAFSDEQRRRPHVVIVDMYTRGIYPKADHLRPAIAHPVSLEKQTPTGEYIALLDATLERAFADCRPDFVVYNAGTDILAGDKLGAQNVSREGVIKRDEMVMGACLTRNIPVLYLTSGGYTQESAAVITESLLNLNARFGLFQLPQS